jgi:uncharacterized membrane protein HdeD (DUF308 family)
VNALTAAGWTIRVTGLALVVLGLLLWIDAATGLRSIHMLLGLVLVVALVTAAVLALRAGAKPILPVIAIVWAILTLAFGMTQTQILPGDGHVVVEVAHLLVGIVAIGLGEALVASGRRGALATA